MILPSIQLAMLVTGAPRVCGDDPGNVEDARKDVDVLPAYAGMILPPCHGVGVTERCSPRMRG